MRDRFVSLAAVLLLVGATGLSPAGALGEDLRAFGPLGAPSLVTPASTPFGIGDRCGALGTSDSLCAEGVAACVAVPLHIDVEHPNLTYEQDFARSDLTRDQTGPVDTENNLHETNKRDDARWLPNGVWFQSWTLHSQCNLDVFDKNRANGYASIEELDLVLDLALVGLSGKLQVSAIAVNAGATVWSDGTSSADSDIADVWINGLELDAGAPANTVVSVNPYIDVVINEQHDHYDGACNRGSAAAFRIIAADPLNPGPPVLEIAIDWVSTMACERATSTIVTTPSSPVVEIGQSVHDTAVVSGSKGTPTGQVDFYVCSVNVVTCDFGGTYLGAGTLDAQGETTSNSFVPSEAGTFCFRGVYRGDSTYKGSVDHSLGECFEVEKVTPTLDTVGDPGFLAEVLPGEGSVSDTATLTGPLPISGTITFYLCSPSDVDPQVGCVGPGREIGGPVTVSNGQANSGPVGTPTDPGVWCWRAEYSGDDKNKAVTHTNADSECFTVVDPEATLTTTAQPGGTILPSQQFWDVAHLTVNGPDAAGEVAFYLCSPFEVSQNGGDCSAGGTHVSTNPVSSNQATSDAKTVSELLAGGEEGRYCFRAEYSGDSNYPPATHTNSDTECFEVQRVSPTVETVGKTISPLSDGGSGGKTGHTGYLVWDTAWVNATATQPTGDVSFYLCNPAQVQANGGDCSSSGTFVSTNALNAGKAVSGGFIIPEGDTSIGTWCWRAVYHGDLDHRWTSHTNGDSECVEILPTLESMETRARPGHSISHGEAWDRAWVNVSGPDPTGTVTFYICDPDEVADNGGNCRFGGEFHDEVTLSGEVADSRGLPIDPMPSGTWCWRAVYSGDANYPPRVHTNSDTECFQRQMVEELIIAVPDMFVDSIMLGPLQPGDPARGAAYLDGDPEPTGEASFWICDPDAVNENGGVCVPEDGVYVSTNPLNSGGNAASDAYQIPEGKPGTWCWFGYYHGDGNWNTNRDSDPNESCVEVQS